MRLIRGSCQDLGQVQSHHKPMLLNQKVDPQDFWQQLSRIAYILPVEPLVGEKRRQEFLSTPLVIGQWAAGPVGLLTVRLVPCHLTAPTRVLRRLVFQADTPSPFRSGIAFVAFEEVRLHFFSIQHRSRSLAGLGRLFVIMNQWEPGLRFIELSSTGPLKSFVMRTSEGSSLPGAPFISLRSIW
jgi:hypothetical protein